MHLRDRASAAPVLALLSMVLTLAVGVWLPVEMLTHVMREGGPIENATAIFYVAAAGAVFFVRDPAFGGLARTAAAFVLACCIAREVSIRRWLLDAPLGAYCCTTAQTYIILGVLLVLLGVAGVWLVARYTRPLYRAFRDGSPVAVTLVTMFGCAALSQVFDSLPKITAGLFRFAISLRGRAVALSLEEVLEMVLPALVVLAVVQARGRRSPEGSGRDCHSAAASAGNDSEENQGFPPKPPFRHGFPP